MNLETLQHSHTFFKYRTEFKVDITFTHLPKTITRFASKNLGFIKGKREYFLTHGTVSGTGCPVRIAVPRLRVVTGAAGHGDFRPWVEGVGHGQ